MHLNAVKCLWGVAKGKRGLEVIVTVVASELVCRSKVFVCDSGKRI